MRASVYVPLVLSALLPPLARIAVRKVAPDVAAKVLTAMAVVAGVCSAWGLTLLAAVLVGQQQFVAREGHWSAGLVAAANPVPHFVSLAAVVLLVVATMRCAQLAVGHLRATWAARGVRPASRQLVVLDDPRPRAFAVPGRRGHIVVTTSMLRALTASERRVLLAHERAHLRHRHHRYRLAMHFAGALNPLVAGAGRDLGFALERWADESAAAAVGDRAAAARSLAHAARLTAGTQGAEMLAFSRLGVVERVAALAAAAPRPRWAAAAAAFLALSVPAAWAAGDATISLARLLAAGGFRP